MPTRVEVRDFVARRFQLSFQIENLRARFRIKIRRGKCGLQIRHRVFRRENIRDAIREYLAAIKETFPAADVREVEVIV